MVAFDLVALAWQEDQGYANSQGTPEHRTYMERANLKNRAFILALAIITLVFGWLLRPFYAAIFWAAALAILFWPIYERILSWMPRKPGTASLLSLLTCMLLLVVPLVLIAASAAQEIGQLYERFLSDGGSGLEARMERIADGAPPWLWQGLERLGLGPFDSVRGQAIRAFEQLLQFLASHAVAFGQDTLQLLANFVLMLYLLFFAFRDGTLLTERLRDTLPLDRSYLGELGHRFETMIKATIKGNLMVAGIQGAIGGILFWALGIQGAVLWGVVMAVLSLVPVLGAWLVWGPVALYLLATGAVFKAAVMALIGAGVIGLIDNLLRPILVGKEARMPDYLVLLSTLGGLSLFGLTGFVAGPVVAAMFMAIWSLSVGEKNGQEREALSVPLVPSDG
ncbi:AI-2E family transporter [Stenotrophomonas sp. MYb57]|uniref:AI-2E family transporter n=1 Tax=Stenotrophomonas sp. MYb57 TaxID=1827305 RepID=UPI0018F89DE0|nr:AI-2E family transporter [Stenotrophomonas sp. MYb57]